MVEGYERPEWTFNKLLYIEKEGFSEMLKDERWGEKHDCAIMSSKGFSTRAATDSDVQISRFWFFMGEPRSWWCTDGRILREARFEDQVAEAIAAIEKPDAAALEDGIEELFEEQPDAQSRDHITAIAEELSDAFKGHCSNPDA
jgi:hypothetical protein